MSHLYNLENNHAIEFYSDGSISLWHGAIFITKLSAQMATDMIAEHERFLEGGEEDNGSNS